MDKDILRESLAELKFGFSISETVMVHASHTDIHKSMLGTLRHCGYCFVIDNIAHKNRNKGDGHVVDPPCKHKLRIPKPRPKDPSNMLLKVMSRFKVDTPCK